MFYDSGMRNVWPEFNTLTQNYCKLIRFLEFGFDDGFYMNRHVEKSFCTIQNVRFANLVKLRITLGDRWASPSINEEALREWRCSLSPFADRQIGYFGCFNPNADMEIIIGTNLSDNDLVRQSVQDMLEEIYADEYRTPVIVLEPRSEPCEQWLFPQRMLLWAPF